MTVRILMVDDEPDAQELFRQNFRREIRKGVYAFVPASSGRSLIPRNLCPALQRQMIKCILSRS